MRNFWEHFDASYEYEDVLHYLRAIYHRKRLNIWMDPISKKEYGNRTENFTLEYYVSDLLMYKNQQVAIDELDKFLQLPEEEQLLEVAASLVAKWCQPELKIAHTDISAKLDAMAKECTIMLRYHHPNHPYFEVDEDTLKKWRNQKLEQQNYRLDQRMQLINIINKVLFDKYKLLGDTFDYYSMSNSFINCVLERKSGLPIILSIVYEGVARRMGLNCEPLNTPVHFLLKLQGEKTAHSILFIDAFNAHTFTRLNEEGKLYSAEKIPTATTKQVLERMVANVDKAWERSGLLHPTIEANDDSFPMLKILNRIRIMGTEYFTDRLHRDPIYDYHRITSQGVLFKESLKNEQFNYRQLIHIVPRCRPTGMLYAVGVIVIHKVSDEVRFYGVIIDWSPVWEERMDPLNEYRNYKANFKSQPFYKVLSENRVIRYLPQEYLSLVVHHYPQRFFHENLDLGKHFSRFEDGVFIPNTAKSKEYCEDDIYRLVISKDVLRRMIRQALRQDDRLTVGYRCQCFKRNGLMCRMPYMSPIFNIFCTCDEPGMC